MLPTTRNWSMSIRAQRAMAVLVAAMTVSSATQAQTGPAVGPEASGVNTADSAEQISDYVVEIYEDRHGHLWFGTMTKGAVRYDGQSLTYFTTADGLAADTVTSFAEDAEGHLWAGTHGGISRFNGKNFEAWGRDKRLPQGGGLVFADRKGNLWASMDFAVFRYDGRESFTRFSLPIDRDAITSYGILPGHASLDLIDQHGNLWFGTDGYGAFRFDGEQFQRFSQADGLCSNNVTGIVEDGQGNLWFSCMQSFKPQQTGDGGVCRWDGQTFTTFPQVDGLSENDIYTIYMDREGMVWLGATGHGVYRYNGDEFQLFPKTDRMDLTYSLGLQAALEDTNGTLWLGFSGGLFRWDGSQIVNVTKAGPWR
ncbi:MAG: two-component regulator propeller domain-containing protein [Planctomycetota bacterium]